MTERPTGAIDVLAGINTSGGTVRLVNYRFFKSADGTLRGDGKFRVELSLSARHPSSRACFREQWKRHRFEHVGELFVVHPHADLVARSDEAFDIKAIVCEIEARPLIDMFDRVPEPSDALLTASLDVRNDRLKSLLLWMAEEARRPGFASPMLTEMLIGQLKIELIRHGASIVEQGHSGGLASWRLRLIDDRLRQTAATPALSELAQLCGLSVRQLTRGFRASRGCSLGAYVAQRQVEHAKRMLSDGQSVDAIAHALGFASSSSFCFAFRRETGVTPKHYRDRLL